jgi:predicted Zn-dependent protease
MSGSNLRWLPLIFGIIAVGVMFIRGCETGPFGRSQLLVLSPEQEAQLGAQAFQQTLARSDVVTGGPAADRVREIGERIARVAMSDDVRRLTRHKLQQFHWEFRVVRSRQVNAFCLPGGKVVFYTGILPVCQNDAGLAAVMGHEIGHALARHGNERMAQSQAVKILTSSAAMSLGNMDPHQQQQIMGLLGAGAQFGVLLPFSRDHESEADHIGIILMAAAGYDPHESIAFWKRMSQQSGGSKTPEWQSTHPSHETRIRDLEKWLDEALPLYRKSQKQASRPLPLN